MTSNILLAFALLLLSVLTFACRGKGDAGEEQKAEPSAGVAQKPAASAAPAAQPVKKDPAEVGAGPSDDEDTDDLDDEDEDLDEEI